MSRFAPTTRYKLSSQRPKLRFSGFSLVETILYIGVLAGILVTLSMVYFNALRSRDLSRAGTRLLQNKTRVELFLFSRLEEAQSITTPVSGTTSELVMSSPTGAENPVTFSVASGIMNMKLGAGAPIELTTDDVTVTGFSVTRGSGSPASVIVSVDYSAQAIGRTFTSRTSFTQTLRYE